MTGSLATDLADRLRAATGQSTIDAALAWIGEGHGLNAQVGAQDLAAAVVAAETAGYGVQGALERISAELSASNLDPAAMLFRAELFPDATALRRSLDTIADASGGSLSNISASAIRAAQHRDSGSMITLEALAGMTHRELGERVGPALPGEPDGAWTNQALTAAFEYIDSQIRGQLPPPAPGAVAPRPAELVDQITGSEASTGWDRIEALRVGGVPYELLLAQRIVGSAWGQHRNRTSKAPVVAVATRLRSLLIDAGFDVALDREYGGDARQRDLATLVDGDKHINMVVREGTALTPFFAVTLSLAKDGGSARKSLSAKIAMRTPRVPVAIVVLGRGFAERNETAALTRHFKGAVYSEMTLDELVNRVRRTSPTRST